MIPTSNSKTPTRRGRSSRDASRGWISPTTPAGRPPTRIIADRAGWKGVCAGSPTDHSLIPKPARSASRPPLASKKSNSRRSEWIPSPAGPVSAAATNSRSSTGGRSPDPSVDVPGQCLEQVGDEAGPEKGLVGGGRVRHPDGFPVPHQLQVRGRGERQRERLTEPRSHQHLPDPPAKQIAGSEPSRLLDTRNRRADRVVPVYAHDLLYQVDLALEVGPEARDFDPDFPVGFLRLHAETAQGIRDVRVGLLKSMHQQGPVRRHGETRAFGGFTHFDGVVK